MFNLLEKFHDVVCDIKPIMRQSLTDVLLNGVWILNPSKDRELSQKLHMMAALYNSSPRAAWFPPSKKKLAEFEKEFIY